MEENKPEDKGLRFNEGKIRYDLLEPFAMEQLAKVFTTGATKYATHNWLKGMAWSKCLASLKRHIAAFEKGEDIDKESGNYHMAHAAWNAMALVSYYKHFPQGDDRLHTILPKPKIGLDIDEVICDWVGAWTKYYKMTVPRTWFFDGRIMEKFEAMRQTNTLDDFYMNLEPKCSPDDIPFEPHCYVTSRPVSTEVTTAWLRKHNFPMRPVITVPAGTSKVDVIKRSGIDIFVDDRYDNYEELNRHGICCFLFDSPHNERYDVGYKRIYSLKDLK